MLLGESLERTVAAHAKADQRTVLGVGPVAVLDNVVIVGQAAARAGVLGGAGVAVVVVETAGAVDFAEIGAEATGEQKSRRESC